MLTQENEAELYISLRSCLLKIQSKNQDHIQHMQLGLDKSKAGVEQGDEVDLQDVMCSVCKRMDAEDNDIILCDKKGCCRAYHQNCLNPPITDTSKLGEHFFCWVCDTLTNCFEEINTMLGINVSSIEELFPSG